MTKIQILILITFILFGVKFLKDTLSFLWFFQIKEYRLDRMKSHVRENSRVNFSDLGVVLGVFILLGLLFPATARFVAVFFVLLLGGIAPLIFLYSFFRLLIGIKNRAFLRPKPTSKIILISVIYFLLFSIFAYQLLFQFLHSVNVVYSPDFFVLFAFYLLVLAILVPFFLLLAILLVTPFSDYRKSKIKERARLKMAGMKRVKTIGIAGSFGKTSTKEFLCAILSQKFKVVKTSGNNNTNMGVANTILSNVNDDFDYFICEMGAYRVGEIKEICGLALPFAGIITGLNEQHLDLFGSIENTKRAKFELIRSLPKDGFAVINEQADKMKPRTGYKVKDVEIFSKSLAENIMVNPDSVEFEYKGAAFRVNILGKHYIENMLSAIIVAEKLGMTLQEIQEAVSNFDPQSKYLMRKQEGAKGAIFIDDSYSANPTGVMAALEYMEDAYPERKKMLVFPGIDELGKNSKEVHRKIWRKADDVCHFAFILQQEDKEIRNKYQKCNFVFEKDFDKMKKEVEKRLGADSVVLFESRGAGVVMKKLLEDKNKKDA